MPAFQPSQPSYRVNTAGVLLPIMIIPVEDVAPVWRELSHGVFNDHPVAGPARQRVTSILKAFCSDTPLPPIDVVRTASKNERPFQMYHGVHRLYCSIAAGFSAIPSIDVTDELAKI